ncbi:MAG: hypothetical protein QOJ62_1537, partial [Actinomycetota bacterium]|nr:hypothetical protein [Actinomycetota bacterium]
MPRAVSNIEHGGDAATRARRFARETVHGWNLDSIVLEAELVTTELVTNAVLHGELPISVELEHRDGVLRVAVADCSLLPPVLGQPGVDAMTGRGLALVASVAKQWGVTPAAPDRKGKVVWAEITANTRIAKDGPGHGPVGGDLDALLEQWDGDGPGERKRYTVELGDVPTDLLLAAKGHVDNVVRELTLASSDSASRTALATPRHLAELLRDVVTNFAEARQSIKRQALAAAARGDDRVALSLVLPASYARAGERYLAALDELDDYARSARLLTVESPPEHRAFRHWYVQSLIDQLRARAAGTAISPPPSFERFLLGEVSTIALANRISDRAARLQRVTAALAGAVQPADVAVIAVTEGLSTLGATGGSLLLLDDAGALVVAGEVGMPELRAMVRAIPATPATPAHAALRTGHAVWTEGQADRERYPGLAALDPQSVATCAVPLVVGDEAIGVLTLSFATAQFFATDDRAFVEALAAETAQTLSRTRLHQEQLQLADRLARLQAVTAELGLRRDVADVCDAAVRHATAAVAAVLGAVCLPTADGHHLRIVEAIGVDPERQEQWRRFPVDGDFPAAEAFRTRAPVVIETADELVRRYPPLAVLPPAQDHTLACLPLRMEHDVIGVLSLSFEPGRVLSAADLDFVIALADVCAQALGRARALEEATAVRDRFAFLAEASAQLASSLNYEQTLRTVADLAVPRL